MLAGSGQTPYVRFCLTCMLLGWCQVADLVASIASLEETNARMERELASLKRQAKKPTEGAAAGPPPPSTAGWDPDSDSGFPPEERLLRRVSL